MAGKLQKYFIIRLVARTGREMEWREAATEAGSGMITAVVAWWLKFAQRGELSELFFLGAFGAICGPLLGFLFRLIFITPGRIVTELEEKVREQGLQIQKLIGDGQISLESSPPRKMSVHSEWQYACDLVICNGNQSLTGVKLKLLNIEPPLRAVYGTSDRYDLDRMVFPIPGAEGGSLNPGEKMPVRVMVVERQSSGITIEFLGEWAQQIQMITRTLFTPQYKDGELLEYYFSFETSAVGVAARATKFRMTFSLDSESPPFKLERV